MSTSYYYRKKHQPRAADLNEGGNVNVTLTEHNYNYVLLHYIMHAVRLCTIAQECMWIARVSYELCNKGKRQQCIKKNAFVTHRSTFNFSFYLSDSNYV